MGAHGWAQTPAPADAALQRGASWLQAQIQPDGQLASEPASAALPLQARSETARTLKALAMQPLPPALLDAIDSPAANTTEYLARQAMARQQAGTADAALLDALIALQNTDGSFGAAAGHPGNPQDTAWALHALAASRASGAAAAQALGWLTAAQQADGAWPLMPDGDAIVSTALAVQALTPYRQQPTAREALAKARAWLTVQRDASQSWGSEMRTAQALLAVLPGLDTAAGMQAPLAALRQSQRSDGSWAGDPHLSALALHALWLAGQPATNPDLASVQGQVVNESGQPIANANVRLMQSGQQARTDARGHFDFVRLTPGSEQLDIQASGFRPLQTQLNLQPGQRLDLGTIRMVALAGGGSATDVTLMGVARYFNGSSYYPANGATIEVGGRSVRADNQGQYRLDGLPPGTLDITASFSNYPLIRAAAQAASGQVIDFSPVFQKPRPSSITLTVTVSDAESTQPLPGATVALSSRAITTNAQGQATFTNGVMLGANSLTISRSGYERVLMQFDAFDGQAHIDLAVALRKATSTQTVLKGVVTDADTQQALPGVSVHLDGSALQTQTDTQGAYAFSSTDLAGSRTIAFEKPGYLSHRQDIQVQAGVTSVLNVPLRPEPAAAGPALLEVSVQVRGTGTPLASAAIVLTGANQRTVQTDADGKALVGNLNPGQTSVKISAPGHEAAIAQLHVRQGQRYVLPVELLPSTSAQHRLYGQVLDAISQQPVTGAQISLTGAASGVATSSANGAYAFDNVALGQMQIEVTHSGYVTFRQAFDLTGTTEARIALTPSWQAPPSGPWEIFGAVVDADTQEPLAGAQLVLEEVLTGAAVLHQQTGVTQAGGRFSFSGLTENNARLFISLNGYDSTLVPFTRQGVASQSLGTIKIKRSYNAALPDLMIGHGDRSALRMDASTFRASGAVSVTLSNNSTYDAGGFDAVAFIDTNGNQSWDAGADTLLGRQRIAALSKQQSQTISFQLVDVALPFRDAPIYVMADSSLEVIENIEGNNTLRIGVSCAGSGGAVQDVAVCIDTSGSVSHLYNLEIEGVIKAVENPNIIAHDGSVRFMLGTDYEMYNGNGIPMHLAQVITPAILPQLIQDLKTKRNPGGYSSGPTCVRRMSEYMKTLPQNSNSKTVITVGDGYWEGIPQALAELPKTVANGINRVDVIGIGNVNLPELEANAWPKPANSLHGGQVTVAYSSAEVAAAMAQALGAVAQTVDLTLGNFRLLDKGTGQPVQLAARVGNAGSPAQASAVRFYQGTRLLGEVALPALQTGQWRDVDLPAVTLQGSDPLIAVVDEARNNAECNTANNRQQIDLAAANALAAISVATDQPVYPSQSPVELSALVRNLGSFDAALSVALQVRDAQGQSVAQFPPHALGQVAAGAQTPHSQAWHTGALSAGGYTLHGQVLAPDGQVLAQAFTPFAIAASGPGAPAAALGVATDRAQYSPDDRVRIDALARNLTANAAIDDARIALEVHGPQGQLIASHTLPVGQLAAGALRAADVLQPLRQAPLGAYTIAATLIGSGRFHGSAMQDVALASASARFEVVAQGGPGPGPSPGAQADYSIRKSAPQPAIAAGGQARWVITVANQGPHDGHGVLIEDALPAGLTQAQWTCSASGQAQCGRASGQGPVRLDALIPSGAGHAVTIVVTATAPAAGTLDNTARINALGGSIDANSANNQASARIAVTGPAPTPGPAPGPGPTPTPGATPGTPPVPVPVGAPWAIIGLLALLLAAHPASRAARRPAARQPHCKNKKP